jgi:hypothetical protein
VVGSRLRFAAGVCILAAGLLAGGGAVAVADPGLGGSSSNGDDGTNDPVQGGPSAGSPVGNVTDTVRETIQGVTGTPGSGAQPGQQPSTGATSTLGSGRQPGQQPSTGATSPKTAAGGTDTEDQKEDAGLVTADPNPLAAVPNVVLPVTDVVAPVTDVVTPVTDVVAPVTSVLAPVSDVIAAGQDMLTLVAGAVVPLTQLPSDLSSFMLGIAGVAPASGGIDGAALSTAAGASLASQLPLGPPLPGIWGVPVAGNATRVATLDVISLGRASALSGMAPQASNGATPRGGESFFRHVLDELLLVASLWALATAALPGLAGLVILIAAGVCVGYRQAKAGFALRTPGTARFVRSGSLVVVRLGALRVERPGALSAGYLLDKVA